MKLFTNNTIMHMESMLLKEQLINKVDTKYLVYQI